MVQKVFDSLLPPGTFVSNWHIEAICFQLERVLRGEVKRLIINLPPRSGKSTVINAFVAFLLGQDPTKRIVVASYGADLAEKHGRDCRTILSSPWYQRAFPRTRLRPNRTGALDFETTRGGGRLSTSVGGPLTGRGGSLIIVDDPQKAEDAYSVTKRQSTIDWFQTTLLSRLDNKKNDAIIVVMQRQHVDDLTGHLVKQGGWELLELPAIATEDTEIDIGHRKTHLRREGEVLYPDREPAEVLEQLRRDMGSHAFEAQYQQNPLPAAGNVIKADWLKSYDVLPPEGGHLVQSWDFAYEEGEANDWTVCVTAKIMGNTVYVLDVFRGKLDFPDQLKAVVEQARRYHPRTILIERAATGSPLVATLKGLGGEGIPTPILVKPTDSKHARVVAQSGRFEAGDVLLPKHAHWRDELVSELVAFPHGRHDDQVDALIQLLQWDQQHRGESEAFFEGMGGKLFDGEGRRLA
ncbi:MAG: phage terminase large subunit [Roseitalea porphyridii]|uniref:phage terminase large subunit n=1 Tax=Roseitalea porphyridii TaxID=1852022 RepID=UPI0032EE5D3B